jgi:hypothetical protein
MDCYVALSGCPQDIVLAQGRPDLKPQDTGINLLNEQFQDIPIRATWVPE